MQVFSRSLFCVEYKIYGFRSCTVAFLPPPLTVTTSTGMIWVTLNMPSAVEECREPSGNFTLHCCKFVSALYTPCTLTIDYFFVQSPWSHLCHIHLSKFVIIPLHYSTLLVLVSSDRQWKNIHNHRRCWALHRPRNYTSSAFVCLRLLWKGDFSLVFFHCRHTVDWVSWNVFDVQSHSRKIVTQWRYCSKSPW